jgi:hypothetical protein
MITIEEGVKGPFKLCVILRERGAGGEKKTNYQINNFYLLTYNFEAFGSKNSCLKEQK